MSCVAAEVQESWSSAALSLTALPQGGGAWLGGWQACRRPVRPCLSPVGPQDGDVRLPACLPPTGLTARDLLAWKENTGRCGQANTATVCPEIGAPVWRELEDRTFCHLPAFFQNSLALPGPGCRGWWGAGCQEPGRGKQALGASRMRRSGEGQDSTLPEPACSAVTCLGGEREREND